MFICWLTKWLFINTLALHCPKAWSLEKTQTQHVILIFVDKQPYCSKRWFYNVLSIGKMIQFTEHKIMHGFFSPSKAMDKNIVYELIKEANPEGNRISHVHKFLWLKNVLEHLSLTTSCILSTRWPIVNNPSKDKRWRNIRCLSQSQQQQPLPILSARNSH